MTKGTKNLFPKNPISLNITRGDVYGFSFSFAGWFVFDSSWLLFSNGLSTFYSPEMGSKRKHICTEGFFCFDHWRPNLDYPPFSQSYETDSMVVSSIDTLHTISTGGIVLGS